MEIKKLIDKYKKSDSAKILHKLRVEARKALSKLQKEGKTDTGLENLLKNSSKLRDTDVLIKICKGKKIQKFLKRKHEKLRKKFLEFLDNFKSEIKPIEKEKEISIEKCLQILNETFLDKDDKTLHKIRIEIKKCRYTHPEYEDVLKLIQDNLGKAHDYYNCEKLRKKFNKDTGKVVKKKNKYIKKAEKVRSVFINDIFSV
ncbi:CHAD domain-containing protein [Lebetimonas sp. JH369]|uniref:CHAD domain-containing protein n=1 Tax=Lebetimonas sp. JH369 TaxID=990069 RepID=UPI000464B460|nr:CHAD domain-containing protein [Lebetimonas sp. JH369]